MKIKWKQGDVMMLKLLKQIENILWKQSEMWEHNMNTTMKQKIENKMKGKWGFTTTLSN
jgi:hypothetical protein